MRCAIALRKAVEAKRSGAAKTTVARAAADVVERLLVVLARGEHHRGVAEVREPRALVAHERDQGRDDHRQVVAGERGELVAEALAAAGRHDDERVAAVQCRLDRLALAGPEGREAEQGEQRLGRRVGGRGPAWRGGARSGGARRRAAERELLRRVEAELRGGRGGGGPRRRRVGVPAGVGLRQRAASTGGRRRGGGRGGAAGRRARRRGGRGRGGAGGRGARRLPLGLAQLGRSGGIERRPVAVRIVGGHGRDALGGELRQRRQRLALLGRELAPARTQLRERGRAMRGIAEDRREQGQGTVQDNAFRASDNTRSGVCTGIQDDEPVGLGRGELVVGLSHAREELAPRLLQPVSVATGDPRETGRRVDPQQQRAVDHDVPDPERVQRPDLRHAQPPPAALVGQRGVDEAIHDHGRARREQRSQPLGHQLRAGGGEQQRLRPRIDRNLRIGDQRPNALGQLDTARLPQHGRAELTGQARDQRRLAGAVEALDRDQHRP